MKKHLKKLGCLVCCLCLAVPLWGCKVETVEQHQQAVSAQAAQTQAGSSETASGKEEADAPESSGQADASGASRQEEPAGEGEKDAGESAGAPSAGGASGEPETPEPAPSSAASGGARPSQGETASTPAGTGSSRTEPESQAPEPEPEPEPEPAPETITVTVSVLCTLAVDNPNLNPGVTVPADGVMVSGLSLELAPGQTAFDALRQTGLTLDYTGSPGRKSVYLRGVGGLYERDCGPGSGWVFSVNGTYPNAGCSAVALNDGDVVSFQFTDGTKLD